MNEKLYRRRVRTNWIGLTLSMAAMAIGLFVLLWILFVLFKNGLSALDWNMFTQSTPRQALRVAVWPMQSWAV